MLSVVLRWVFCKRCRGKARQGKARQTHTLTLFSEREEEGMRRRVENESSEEKETSHKPSWAGDGSGLGGGIRNKDTMGGTYIPTCLEGIHPPSTIRVDHGPWPMMHPSMPPHSTQTGLVLVSRTSHKASKKVPRSPPTATTES